MDKQTLIAHLNDDLASEFGAIIQYITYAAKATGPFRPQLAQFFLTEAADEQLHAQFLANKIVAMGGEPTTTPKPVPAADTNRAMLEAVLAAELEAGRGYTKRAQEAEAYGDKGLVVTLEDMIRDEMGHSEETERMLRDWPL
ncbi:MAG: ferritin-like domain-containing protein [Chloroflexi bacterium]|nr:ferritin-like domain-containing protein [Chloroflexota bacterium]MBP7045428.1 ferritin-like domain-containing protein [Chloroflexota bacterium]